MKRRVSFQSCSTLSLCGVLVHLVAIVILVYKMYVRVLLFFCLGVIGKIDGDGIFSVNFLPSIRKITSQTTKAFPNEYIGSVTNEKEKNSIK